MIATCLVKPHFNPCLALCSGIKDNMGSDYCCPFKNGIQIRAVWVIGDGGPVYPSSVSLRPSIREGGKRGKASMTFKLGHSSIVGPVGPEQRVVVFDGGRRGSEPGNLSQLYGHGPKQRL